MPFVPQGCYCGDSEWDLLVRILEQDIASFNRQQQILNAINSSDLTTDNSNINGINGVTPSVGCGIATTGTLRVSQATDCNVTVVQGTGTNLHTVIDSGTLTTVSTVTSVTALVAITGSVTPGTAAANLGKAEDSPHTTGDVGVMSLAVRNDTGAVLAGTDLDYIPITTDASGNVRVTTGSVTPGTGASNLGKAEDSVAASGDVGVFALAVANVAQTTLAADGDYIAHVTDLAGNTMVVGNLANDAVDAGNPVKVGAQARTTLPTAVADGDRVNLIAGKHGSLVTIHALREMLAQQVTTITTSTAETTIVTAVASVFLDLYGLIVTNTSATAVTVAIKDATAGTTRLNIAVPAGETRGFMLPACDGHKQAVVNNNWTATVSASVTSVIITAFTRQTT